MTVGKKVALTCGTLLTVNVLLSSIALQGIQRLNKRSQSLANESLKGLGILAELDNALLETRGNHWKHIALTDSTAKARVEAADGAWIKEVDEKLNEYSSVCFEPEDRALYSKLKSLWEQFQQSWAPIEALSRAGKSDEAGRRHLSDITPLSTELRKTIRDLEGYNRKQGSNNAELSRIEFQSVRFWTWSLLSLAVALGSVMVFFVVSGLTRTLLTTAGELSLGAEQTVNASAQVSSSSQTLAQGASEQAASLEETSASTEEINAMTQRNAENSKAAAELTAKVDTQVKEANQNLTLMTTAMYEINSSSESISKIIKVIDEIAFQTNILALNAAVEAARAGEAGMGFAVVADEVRNLAQRSAQAARDTAALIEGSISKSKNGRAKLSEVERSIQSITGTASQLRVLIDQVHVGSQEQARGIGEIAKAVMQMEKVTQSNAASAEESASAAEELNAQAAVVNEAVGRLKSLVSSNSEA